MVPGRVSVMLPLRRHASWKIPTNAIKHNDPEMRTIRLKPSELNHPFYNIGPMEQFLVCFRYHDATLLHGKPAFPVYDRNTDLHVPTALRFASTYDLPEWVDHYSFHVHNNVFKESQQLKLVTKREVAESAKGSYITPETSASIGSIVLLFQRNADALKPLPPLKLTSLIDGVVLTTDGVFTEDLYTYILQTQEMTPANLSLVLSSMLHHMEERKLDQFPIIDKLVSQTVTAIMGSLESSRGEVPPSIVADFEEFLTTVRVKFPGDLFTKTTNLQLLGLNLKIGNITKSKEYLRSLILVHNSIPEVEYIESYLRLLQNRFPDDRTTKLAYISFLTSCLEHQMVPALVQFCIPLCIDFIELQSLFKMVMKNTKSAKGVDTKVLSAFLNQVQAIGDGNVMSGIFLNRLCNKMVANGIDMTPYISLFVKAYTECQDFTMVAQLIESEQFSLHDSECLEDLVQAIKNNETSEIPFLAKKGEAFLAEYILPVWKEVGLSETSSEYILSKQTN